VEQLGFYWADIHKIWYLKSVEKIQVSLKSGKNNEELYMNTCVHLW
jgi:hypothetical protein